MLGMLPCVLLAPGFFSSQIPLELRGAFFEPPWQEARPVGMEAPAHPHSELHVRRTYPWYRFLHDTAAEGDSLLWNPNEGFGSPFLALWRSRVLSPFSIPFYFMPVAAALQFSLLLKLVVAGWCAFYASRRFGLHPAMALFVGASFQISGPVFLYGALPIADTVPWLPLLLVTSERLLLGNFRAWPLAAVVVALCALGGEPGALAAMVVFLLLYLLARGVRSHAWTHVGGACAGMCVAVVLGLGLAAVQVAPYLEFNTQGAVESLGARACWVPSDLAAILCPCFLAPSRAQEAPGAWLLHIGIVQLLLLALWFGVRRYASKDLRRRVEALLMAALVTACIPVVLSLFVQGWPLFGLLAPEHFLVAQAFAFAFAAAAAAEEWNLLGPDETKSTLVRLLIYLPVVWGLLGAGMVFAVGSTELAWADVWPYAAMVAAAGLAILVLLGMTLLRPSPRRMGYGLCAVAVLTLWLSFRAHVPGTPPELVYPETGFIASLERMDGRIGGSGALERWPLAAHRIPQVFNPAGTRLNRYEAFVRRVHEDPLLLRRAGAPALVLTKEDIQGPFAPVRPELNIQEVLPSGALLFRDLDARSRARVIYAGQTGAGLEPERIASHLPPLLEGVTLPGHDDGKQAAAHIVPPSSNTELTIEIEQTRPGVLVLADAWYPGWRATVDGQPAPIFPVDGVFRGVEVGEGVHTVRFQYEPVSLQVGLYVTLACAVVVLFSMRHLVFRRRRAR